MATVFTPYVLVLIAIAAATAGLAAYAWRRDEYGTRSFGWLLLVFTAYATTHAIGLLTPVESTRLLLNRLQWIATAAVPLAWILFALEYTGWDELLTPRVSGALAAVPVVTVVIVWSNPWHGLMWTHNSLDIVNGFAILDQAFGPWFWVYVVYTYGVILAGIALFARLVWVSDRLYLDQSALLLVGAVAPLVASVSTLLGLSIVQNPTLDMTPYGFAVSGLAFGYAVFRHRLFDIVPATRQLGRRAAIHDLEDGVVIVDRDRRVIYCNPAAATLLETSPEAMTGESIRSVIEAETIDFDTDDAVAELERDEATYEIRTSPIRDRRDSIVGHTLLISDITERRHRVRRLEQQREELRRVEVLNSVLRGINRVLVSATTREEIERDVCEHLAGSELYQTAFITDPPTWRGNADRWTTAGEQIDPRTLPEAVDGEGFGSDDQVDAAITVDGPEEDDRGSWAIVPLVHRRTVYGVLGLYSRRVSLTDGSSREREILAELGATVGHAINAVENRRLLTNETTIELELRSRDEDGPLLQVASETDCELEVTGIVPGGEGGSGATAYIDVTGAPTQAATALEDASAGSVKPIRTDGGQGLLEWSVPRESLVGTVLEHSIGILRVTVESDHLECLVEVASEANVRAMLDELHETFPETRLEAKRQRDLDPLERSGSLPGGVVEELTDRQREALEAAYHAGYFEWPRESSAEDVAEALDISRPTFQGHLRKAEDAVLAELFSSDDADSVTHD